MASSKMKDTKRIGVDYEMEFKNRFELQTFIGELLDEKMGQEVVEVSSSTNETTGRCDLEIEFQNGDTAKMSIVMKSSDGKEK